MVHRLGSYWTCEVEIQAFGYRWRQNFFQCWRRPWMAFCWLFLRQIFFRTIRVWTRYFSFSDRVSCQYNTALYVKFYCNKIKLILTAKWYWLNRINGYKHSIFKNQHISILWNTDPSWLNTNVFRLLLGVSFSFSTSVARSDVTNDRFNLARALSYVAKILRKYTIIFISTTIIHTLLCQFALFSNLILNGYQSKSKCTTYHYVSTVY